VPRLAAQREEALQKGDQQKATELDRAPQVKLGWKVVQMERRGDFSDRGDQLRAVNAQNVQRQAVVLDIGQLRTQLAKRQEEATARRRQAEQKKILGQVEQAFRGQSKMGQEAILNRWRYLAGKQIPEVENARAIWEQDPVNPDAKAWGKPGARSIGKASRWRRARRPSQIGTGPTRCNLSSCGLDC
jgi:hypothetical protein